MSKMQEAFEKWASNENYDTERNPYAPDYYSNGATYNAWLGYQAAIADVKAGGVIASVAAPNEAIQYIHLIRNCDMAGMVGAKLYKLPEDV